MVICAAALSSCGSEQSGKGDGRIKVVATIFPEYDWTRAVIGHISAESEDASGADLTLLVSNGADLHSYQPSVKDIMTISTCDVFVYVGGESDQWVSNVLDRADNKDMKVICLMDVLGDSAVEEEAVEGMEDHEGHHDHHEDDNDDDDHNDDGDDHDHDHDDYDDDHEEPEYDEHVWLSLRNAELFCVAIRDALSEADPVNADAYRKNAEEYIRQLDELDTEYNQAVESAAKDVLVFGDRFPFRYLTDDYGLKYYAAFTGCSAETEASFETVRFLADKVDEYGLGSIMTIDGSDRKIAETVAANTKDKNQKILTFDSMQSVTQKEIDSGKTYLASMEMNLSVLKESLN